MLNRLSRRALLAALLALGLASLVPLQAPAAPADPLPSWNDAPTKKSILDFVAAVTKEDAEIAGLVIVVAVTFAVLPAGIVKGAL